MVQNSIAEPENIVSLFKTNVKYNSIIYKLKINTIILCQKIIRKHTSG